VTIRAKFIVKRDRFVSPEGKRKIEKVDLTLSNLSVLKTGKAKAITNLFIKNCVYI
jgi:DNA-binding Xre family transcriptional regulator